MDFTMDKVLPAVNPPLQAVRRSGRAHVVTATRESEAAAAAQEDTAFCMPARCGGRERDSQAVLVKVCARILVRIIRLFL